MFGTNEKHILRDVVTRIDRIIINAGYVDQN